MRIICLILGLWLITQRGASQEAAGAQTVPSALRLPERGEAPRYPDDLVIGELGQGQASEGAYLFARSIMSALIEGRTGAQVFTDSGSVLAESVFSEVRSIRPRSYRLGGGRAETDGSVSFLVRIIGPEESITGELFIRLSEASETARWLLDDLILEEKRALSEIRDSYRFDFSPYERFY